LDRVERLAPCAVSPHLATRCSGNVHESRRGRLLVFLWDLRENT
jgi:hypothetical protein